MIFGHFRASVGLVGLVVLAAACEPASITEARDQLARGGERSIVYALPVIDTVFKVEELLGDSDIDTTAGGLLAIAVEADPIDVPIGDEIVFEGVSLDTSAVSFTGGQLAVPPGTTVPFSVSYAGLLADTVLDFVDTVLVESGQLSVTTRNKLPIPVTYTVTLNGFIQPGGAPLTGNGTVSAAPGNGTYREDVLTFDLANVTLVPASVTVDLAGSVTVGGPPIPAGLGDSAIVQFGAMTTLQVAAVSGVLDPDLTDALNVTVEEWDEIPYEDLDLGDLEDPFEESTINHATIALSAVNGADIQLVLSDFYLGVVNLDAFGNVPRDGLGNPTYEVDGTGNPILVRVSDPGLTTLTLPAAGSKDVDVDAAPLVDRLVHLLLDDERAALIAAGDVAAGDSTQARVTSSDIVTVSMRITIGMDITVPATGVAFDRNHVGDGMDFDDEDADQLVERLDSAAVIAEAVNSTPFGVEIDIALVGDSLGDDVDVFGYPGAVQLSTIYLAQPTVDANGLVTTPGTSTLTIELTGEQARVLLGMKFTAGIRARMLPGTGGGGRGAIRATDEVSLTTSARIVLRSGGGQ